MENVKNRRDIKLVTDKRRKWLVSEPNCHSHKKFSEHLMAIEKVKSKSDKAIIVRYVNIR